METEPLCSDPALYKKLVDCALVGLSGGYVDGMLQAGSPAIRTLSRKTHERFQMGEDEKIPCTFSGFSFERNKDGCLEQHHNFYLRKLEKLRLESPFTKFRSTRMRLALLSNARPDRQLETSHLAQVTKDRFKDQRPAIIRRLNKATKYAVDNRISLKIPQLDMDSLRIVCFSDASFVKKPRLFHAARTHLLSG